MERGDARGSSPQDSCMEAIELLKPSVIACRIFAVPMPEGVSVGVFLHGKNIFTRQKIYTAKMPEGVSRV